MIKGDAKTHVAAVNEAQNVDFSDIDGYRYTPVIANCLRTLSVRNTICDSPGLPMGTQLRSLLKLSILLDRLVCRVSKSGGAQGSASPRQYKFC